MPKQKLLRDDIEYLVHCESDGAVIGPISKIHAHLPGVKENLTHYSTWSMVFHPASMKYGIQLKNPNKYGKSNFDKWDMSAAGHNPYIAENDDYRFVDFSENLVKEAREEIGLTVKVYDQLDAFLKSAENLEEQAIGFIFNKFHYKSEIYNEFVGLGIILTPTIKLEFKDKEVIDFKWLSPKELRDFLSGDNKYCAPLPVAFKKAEEFRLKYLKRLFYSDISLYKKPL